MLCLFDEEKYRRMMGGGDAMREPKRRPPHANQEHVLLSAIKTIVL